MSEEQQTSSAQGATPAADTPEMGNTSGGATPPTKSTPAAEELLKEIEELKRSHGNAKEELDRHRKKLTAYEKKEAEADAARKEAEEAQLSQLERTQKQLSELQDHLQMKQDRIVRYEIERQAQKLGIIDPDAAATLLLQNRSELELDEDGSPKNAEKLLEALVKNKPYLVPKQEQQQQQQTPAQTAQPARSAPVIPAMSPGRSNIPAPGTTPSGKFPTLDDYYRQSRHS